MSEPELERFLDEERVLTCATLGPTGRPHLMPLWYVRDGPVLLARHPGHVAHDGLVVRDEDAKRHRTPRSDPHARQRDASGGRRQSPAWGIRLGEGARTGARRTGRRRSFSSV